MPENVGFIGLGNIGGPIASSVLRAEIPMVAYDKDPEALDVYVKMGAQPAASAKDVAARTPVVLLSLPNSPIVEDVCLGADGVIEGAAPGTIVVDLSSGDPPHTKRIGAALAEKGIDFMDSGVSGGPEGAAAGTLTLFMGGEQAVYEKVKYALDAIATAHYLMGPLGTGHEAKALNNLMGAANMAIAYEVCQVAEKAGMDVPKLVEAISISSGKNRAVEERIPNFWASGAFGGDLRYEMISRYVVKDVGTACSVGKTYSVPMFMANLVHQIVMKVSDETGGGRRPLID